MTGTVALSAEGTRASCKTAYMDFHEARAVGKDADARSIDKNWKIHFTADAEFDSFEAHSALELEIRESKRGFFVGNAGFSNSRRFNARGQSRDGCVAVLIENEEGEEEGASPHERLLLLGDLSENGKEMQGRFVRVVYRRVVQVGSFRGNALVTSQSGLVGGKSGGCDNYETQSELKKKKP